MRDSHSFIKDPRVYSLKKKNRSLSGWISPRPGCLAASETGGCSILSTVCQLPVMWFSRSCFTSAPGSWLNWACCQGNRLCQRSPRSVFPWRPDTLIIWGIAEDVGGVWSACQMSFWSTRVLSKRQIEKREGNATSGAAAAAVHHRVRRASSSVAAVDASVN